MNRISLYFLIVIIIIFSISCKKKKTTETNNNTTTIPAEANIDLKINNTIAGQPINFGIIKYSNLAGNSYSVSTLQYYISDIELTKSDNTLYVVNSTTLIDAAITSKQSITLANVPNATYKNIKLHIGVNSAKNHTGLQEGDLDPMYGMFWTWNTGYIFFKHDGQFIDSLSATQGLSFHYGSDAAYATVNLPVNFNVNGVAKNVYLNFDLNKLYASPNKIDFDFGNNHQSTAKSDSAWIVKMGQNFNHSFSFDHAE